MNKFSKITGSIIVASLLFSMNGCGDDDDKQSTSSALTEVADNAGSLNDTVNGTESNKVDFTKVSNELKRAIAAGGENVDLGTIISSVMLNEQTTSKEFLLDLYKDKGSAKIDEVNALTEEEASALIATAFFDAAGDKSNKTTAQKSHSRTQNKLLDDIKDFFVDALDSQVGEAVTSAAFELVLQSGTITDVALDMALGSNTVMKVMINAMNNDWSLAASMQGFLENDVEFGHKFMDLAQAHANIADGESEPRNGYSTDENGDFILDANGSKMPRLLMAEFLFSRIDAGMYKSLTIAMSNSRKATDNARPGYMTEILSKLMARPDMTKFFEIPTDLTYEDGISNTAFTKLLFSNGNTVTIEDGVVTGHGDGTELANERFFYEMFATPESTANFITAMNNVVADANLGEETKITLMNQIFLAQNDALGLDDEEQAYFNIYSIAGGMAKGLGEGGANFTAYEDNFIGFAKLMPYSLDSFSYGASFVSALSSYFDNNESAYADEFKTLFRGTSFDVDDNDSLINDYFAVKASFDEALDYLGLLSDDAISFVNGVDFDKLYEGTTRVQFFSTLPAQSVETYSPLTLEAEYLNTKLYGSELTWDYIPNKFAQRDWLKADNNVTEATFSYSGGVVKAYVVSTASLEVVNNDTGVTFTAIDLEGDTLLSSDVNATYNLYSMDIATDTTINLTALTPSSVSALFFDCSNATPNASELPADTNATN